MHPRIRLKDIFVSVFLMPYWGITALLRLDYHLRTPQMLRLFRSPKNKKVVVSDTTITRVLTWLNAQDSRGALLAPLTTLNKEGLLQLRLAPKRPSSFCLSSISCWVLLHLSCGSWIQCTSINPASRLYETNMRTCSSNTALMKMMWIPSSFVTCWRTPKHCLLLPKCGH